MTFNHYVALPKQPLLALIALIGLASCATAPLPESSAVVSSSATRSTPVVVDSESAEEPAPEPTLFLGDDQMIVLPAPRPPIRLDGEAVMLNFEEAPLNEVVHTVLGDTLGLDYVIENSIPGTITLRTRSPIPRDELLPILESLLRSNNVLMIRGPNDRFFISASANIRSAVPRFDSSPSSGFSHVVVPLQYIGATEMSEILSPVAPADALVRVDPQRNLLILAGTQMQLEGWLDIVTTFDIDQLSGMSVGFFSLQNATVEEVLGEIEQIIRAAGGDGKSGGLMDMVKVMPVERLNSIMAVSPRAHYIDTVRQWVTELDNIEDSSSETTLHVYSVHNGDASNLAQLLSTIYGGSGGSGAERGGVAPGMRQAQTGGGAGGMGDMPQRQSRTAGGGSFTLGEEMGDDVKVVADPYNNSLLVHATPYEYQKIERILRKLDVVATQVLIEASIIEVTLIDDLEYGLEWAFDNNLGGGDTGSGLLDLGGGLGPKAGFSYSFTNGAGDFTAVLNALAEKSLINVISTPSVLVLDNHTAAIHVGFQQPIQGQSTITNGGNVQNSISYKDTGVKLQVTPSVNDGGLVKLDIDQSVTDVGNVDAATNQRSFLERNVSSRVAVRSGESIVLGGLIRDNEAEGRSGVPLLMDIPLVGGLFSTTTNESSRTELLIFITPRVMESDQDLRDLNIEMRDRMRGLTNFEDLPVNFSDSSISSD